MTQWQMKIIDIYRFANEWATNASNSRLFLIFLPPILNGTTT